MRSYPPRWQSPNKQALFDHVCRRAACMRAPLRSRGAQQAPPLGGAVGGSALVLTDIIEPE